MKAGLFEILAFIAGSSLSGSMIMVEILLGTSRPVAAEFLLLHTLVSFKN